MIVAVVVEWIDRISSSGVDSGCLRVVGVAVEEEPESVASHSLGMSDLLSGEPQLLRSSQLEDCCQLFVRFFAAPPLLQDASQS